MEYSEKQILDLYQSYIDDAACVLNLNSSLIRWIYNGLENKDELNIEYVTGILKKHNKLPIYIHQQHIDDIILKYKSGNSVSDLLKTYAYLTRKRIETILKNEGIYCKFGVIDLKCPIRKRQNIQKSEKIKKRVYEKYGVDNISQFDNQWKKLNVIPYKKIEFLDEDYITYCKQVDFYTKKNIKNIKKVDFCEYVGIKFASEPCNPNNPLKWSIDHKIPKIYGYLMEIDCKVIASEDNIKQVLKSINSIKANSSYESMEILFKKIRKKLINEGYEHN